MFISAVINELRRTLALYHAYLLSAFGIPIVYSIAFLLLTTIFENIALAQGSHYDTGEQVATLIGVITWFICFGTLGAIPNMVQREATEGTLAVVVATSPQFGLLLLARVIATVIERTVIGLLMGIVLMFSIKVNVSISMLTTLIFLLTALGAMGCSLAFTGLVFVNSHVAPLVRTLVSLALFVSGALVPINSMPTLFALLKIIFPTTWGIDLLRQSILLNSVQVTELAGLLLQTGIFMLLGLISFRYGIKRAQINGSYTTA